MEKWTSDFKTERKNEFLEFKIFFKILINLIYPNILL